MNLNVQSVHKKSDQLELLLVEEKVDVLCLNEHWLTQDSVGAFQINNYVVCGCSVRVSRRGGGTLIMVKNCYEATAISEVRKFVIEGNIELCAVHISEINCVVVSIYRPPTGDIDIFLNNLEAVLTELAEAFQKENILLAGDFNINFKADSKSKVSLLELCNMFGLNQIINETTISQ